MSELVLLSNGVLFDKIQAHKLGLKHYAFSVIIVNENKEILIQRRSLTKYHSPGLWSNTCCSHPLNISSIDIIGKQACDRLIKELGIAISNLNYSRKIEYTLKCNELIENEIDFVFMGKYSGPIVINPHEVSDYRWESYENILRKINCNPEAFTTWFIYIMRMIQNQQLSLI